MSPPPPSAISPDSPTRCEQSPTGNHVTIDNPVRLPGLDGLRAGAVTLVVVYHLWPWLLPGGFLGVTVFFALSGYLITTLLCAERRSTGRVDVRQFYVRRIRRLLPASLGVLAVVVTVWAVAGWMTRDLRTETSFTVLQLANWGQIVGGEAYGAALAPSPIVHYWSLAIEEQVYLVLPVLVALVARAKVLLGVMVAGVLASVVFTATAGGDHSVVYFSTFTRMGEILIGAVVALLPLHRVTAFRRSPMVLAIVAVVAGGVVVTASVMWSVQTEVVYRGGLLGIGAVAAVLVASVSALPAAAVLLDARPIRWIGEHSYGIYLIHWPLLVGLGAAGVAAWSVPWLTVALTIVGAVAMARFIERPIRFGGVPVRRVVVGLTGFGASRAVPTTDFEAVARQTDELMAERMAQRSAPVRNPIPEVAGAAVQLDRGSGTTIAGEVVWPADQSTAHERSQPSTTTGSVGPLSAIDGDVVYAYVGDSKALTLLNGLLEDPPPKWQVGFSHALLGCPLGRGGERRYASSFGDQRPNDVEECDWEQPIRNGRSNGPIDIAVVWFGSWDVVERRVPALGNQWTTIEDLRYRSWLLEEFETITDLLIDELGVRLVVFVTVPHLDYTEPSSVDQWNDLVQQHVATRPAELLALDIAQWVRAIGQADVLMPDGIHLGDNQNRSVAARRVHDELIDPVARTALGLMR